MKNFLPTLILISFCFVAACTPEAVEPLMPQEQSVLVTSDRESPKSGVNVRLNGKNPLLIVYKGKKEIFTPFEEINPNDIASIDVLKGKAAESIYGDKGRDGVVIVRLKN